LLIRETRRGHTRRGILVNGACRVWEVPWKLCSRSWKRLNGRQHRTFTMCGGAKNGVEVLDNTECARTRMHGLREEGKSRVSYEKKLGKKEFLNLGTVKSRE
jgi:hypothetical protein